METPTVGSTITTAEQLDALPKGAVLARVHSDGSGPTVYVNERRMGWLMATEQITPPSVSDLDAVGNRLGHLTVLYVPGEPSRPSVTDNTRAEAWPEYVPLDLVNRVVDYLMICGTRDGLILANEVNTLLGASARRRAAGRAETTTATDEDAALLEDEDGAPYPEHVQQAHRAAAEVIDALTSSLGYGYMPSADRDAWAARLLATARPDTTTEWGVLFGAYEPGAVPVFFSREKQARRVASKGPGRTLVRREVTAWTEAGQ